MGAIQARCVVSARDIARFKAGDISCLIQHAFERAVKEQFIPEAVVVGEDIIDLGTHQLDGLFHYDNKLRRQMAEYRTMAKFCRRFRVEEPEIDPCVFYWIH